MEQTINQHEWMGVAYEPEICIHCECVRKKIDEGPTIKYIHSDRNNRLSTFEPPCINRTPVKEAGAND